jgi:uncharacterized delta-60 repeat protein
VRHLRRSPVPTLALFLGMLIASTPARATGGELDRSFGSGGKVITHFAGAAGADAVAVSETGIVVGGSTGSRAVVARYLPDGTLDSGFGRAGKLLPHVGAKGADRALVDLAVTPGGGVLLLIAGGISYRTFLVRYGPTGHLDRVFGNGGKIRLDDALQFPTGIALLPNGRIVAAGSDSSDVVVERLLPDGRPDPSFGTHGVVTTDVGGLQNLGGNVHVQRNRRIVVVGARMSTASRSARTC